MWKLALCCMMSVLLVPWSSAAAETPISFDDALKRLGHDEFKERMAAQDELRQWAKERVQEGIQVFYRLYRTHEEPEVRLRCRELLKELVLLTLAKEGEGYIGVRMLDQAVVRPNQPPVNAVRITQVMPGTPAERAKLQAGDLVTGIDDLKFGQRIATDAFGTYVRSKKPQETVTLHLLRQGEAIKQKVELMKRPPLDEALFIPLNGDFVIPDQATLEEEEFRDWLKERVAQEAAKPGAEAEIPGN